MTGGAEPWWLGAALAAWAAFARHRTEPSDRVRFAAALALGAALGHLAFVALHWNRLDARPAVWLAPVGFTVLALPLGPLIAFAGCGARARAAAMAALPLALAAARGGCLATGCCAGRDGLPAGLPATLEIAGWLALHLGLAGRAPPPWACGAVLAALGAIRLAVEPLRAPPALGTPMVHPSWIAGTWLAAGLALLAWPVVSRRLGPALASRRQRVRRDRREERPWAHRTSSTGSSTSSSNAAGSGPSGATS